MVSTDSPSLLPCAAAAVGGVLTVGWLWRSYSSSKRAKELQKVADQARLRRDAKYHAVLEEPLSLPATTPDGTPYENLTAAQISSMVQAGSLDAADLARFLAHRCAKYGRDNCVNAITEEFYDDAVYEARRCGARPYKFLQGVPVSIKDCLGQIGALSTGGLACRAAESHRSAENSAVVQAIVDAGAVILARGNVPQSMMLPESENHIFGRTLNPWDLTRTPGGSSGGDAALVATKCVALGVGTDVGGSIRIPAAFCGVIGFKPTPHRISKKNCMVPRKDERHGLALVIPSVIGPIARTVEDCALLMQAVWTEEHFRKDSSVPPMKFKKPVYEGKKKLKIGYFKTDEWFEPCKAVSRGLDETIAKLKQAGHDLVEFPLPTPGWKTYPLYIAISGGDGNMRGFIEGLEGENLMQMYNKVKRATSIPNVIRPVLEAVIDKRRASLLACTRNGGISTYDFLQRCAEAMELRKKWADAFLQLDLDAVIHPTLPLPALHCGDSADMTSMLSYTMLANLLLWPSGTCPVTLIQEDEQSYPLEALPPNQRDDFAKYAQKCMRGSAGLPVSVAVLTPPFHDEMCLRVMREVESAVQFTYEPTNYMDV